MTEQRLRTFALLVSLVVLLAVFLILAIRGTDIPESLIGLLGIPLSTIVYREHQVAKARKKEEAKDAGD